MISESIRVRLKTNTRSYASISRAKTSLLVPKPHSVQVVKLSHTPSFATLGFDVLDCTSTVPPLDHRVTLSPLHHQGHRTSGPSIRPIPTYGCPWNQTPSDHSPVLPWRWCPCVLPAKTATSMLGYGIPPRRIPSEPLPLGYLDSPTVVGTELHPRGGPEHFPCAEGRHWWRGNSPDRFCGGNCK